MLNRNNRTSLLGVAGTIHIPWLYSLLKVYQRCKAHLLILWNSKHIIVILWLTTLVPAALHAAPENLPERIYFRTKTESFNHRYYIALRNDTLWYKDNEETTGKKTLWRLFGKTGKPEKKQFDRFGLPSKITSISADGIHLMALSDVGVFYRGTNFAKNSRHGFTWNDKWGWWGAKGPGLKNEIGALAWSVSDAFPLDLKYYEDGNGKRHTIGFGVAHLYALGPDSTSIYYNDWWLPADWSRQVPPPCRGTFVMVNLSASGSTLFVIGKDGRMFTRMYDFDMNGENPLLTYSYVKQGNTGTTRKLPMPDWQLQPGITAGKTTSKITVFQNGVGNESRVLRVEGEQQRKTGYFFKPIFDSVWQFTETGYPIDQPFLVRDSSLRTSKQPTGSGDRCLLGFLTRESINDTLELEFTDFNIVCPPARIRPLFRGQPLMGEYGEVTLDFYHSQTLVTKIRPPDFWDKGIAADIWGAIIVPDSLYHNIRIEDGVRLRQFFGNRKVVNFIGKATRDNIEMDQISTFQKNPSWVPFFVVPADEKGNRREYHLSATVRKDHVPPALSGPDVQ